MLVNLPTMLIFWTLLGLTAWKMRGSFTVRATLRNVRVLRQYREDI